MITLTKRLLMGNQKPEFSFFRKKVNGDLSQKSFISCKFYKTLNLPIPPKRPLNPYFKFLQNTRLAITRDKEHLKPHQVVKLAAQEWSNIDPQKKKALQEQYSQEIMSYYQDVKAYKQSLTQEQRDVIKKKKKTRNFLKNSLN
ncbi:hypothetical protein TKK_0013834 [Trichogramma kaykai]|uniref:HMG box domain-containing protein n=1 Tax=Trichogramma kaykai TaxID=54128 RepID=A0ABD2WH37_9HYME